MTLGEIVIQLSQVGASIIGFVNQLASGKVPATLKPDLELANTILRDALQETVAIHAAQQAELDAAVQKGGR